MAETTRGTFEVSPPQELAKLRVSQRHGEYLAKKPYACGRCGEKFYDHRAYGKHLGDRECKPEPRPKKRPPKQLPLFGGERRGQRR